MVYPPTLPPTNRTDSTVSAVNHAADHNKLAAAFVDFLAELGANPSGAYADLTTRLADMPTTPELSDAVEAAELARDAAIAAAAEAAAPAEGQVSLALMRQQHNAWDAIVEVMRPRSYVATYFVQAGLTNGAAFGVYPTYNAAYLAAKADHDRLIAGSATKDGQTNPFQRRRIIMAPGTYNEQLTSYPFLDVIGATGNRADVVFTYAGNANVTSTTGKSVYYAHFTLEHTGDDPEWHPLRDAGYSGDLDMGLRQRRAVILNNIAFKCSPTGLAGKGAIDGGNAQGTVIVFANCGFYCPGQPQVMSWSTNLNGAAGSPPGRTYFLNCHVQANYDFYPDPTLPNNGVTGWAAPIGMTDKGSGRGDSNTWVGGTFDYGTHQPVGATVVIAGGNTAGHNAKFYIDPNLPALGNFEGTVPTIEAKGVIAMRLNESAANVVRENRVFDVPVAGLTRQMSDYFGAESGAPYPAAASGIVPPVPVTGKATLVPNRVYFVYTPLPPKTIQARRVRVGVGVAAGNAAAALIIDNGAGVPLTDGNAIRAAAPTEVTPTAWLGELADRFYFPGHGGIWQAFVTDSATATFDVNADAVGAGALVFYKDGWAGGTIPIPAAGTLTALPAGQAAPIPTLLENAENAPFFVTVGGSFNYTIPPGCKSIEVIALGAGGGGGSGRRGAAGTLRCGGGGGGAGGVSRATFDVRKLPGRSVSGNIADGGVGGAAVTADDTNGNNGAAGGQTYVTAGGLEILRASGGAGGSGGTAATGAGGAGGAGLDGSGVNGADAATSANPSGASTTGPLKGGSGGGSGGGIGTNNVVQAGGSAGTPQLRGLTSALVGGTAGAAGANGSDGLTYPYGADVSAGGGGGGSSSTAAAGSGGKGGNYSGGGGGGGASLNGNASGAGGKGGRGAVLIIPHF
jgi:hypothetical protein